MSPMYYLLFAKKKKEEKTIGRNMSLKINKRTRKEVPRFENETVLQRHGCVFTRISEKGEAGGAERPETPTATAAAAAAPALPKPCKLQASCKKQR